MLVVDVPELKYNRLDSKISMFVPLDLHWGPRHLKYQGQGAPTDTTYANDFPSGETPDMITRNRDGVLTHICGRTWVGIEYGEPPVLNKTFRLLIIFTMVVTSSLRT